MIFQRKNGWRGRRRCYGRGANVFGHGIQTANQIFNGFLRQLKVDP